MENYEKCCSVNNISRLHSLCKVIINILQNLRILDDHCLIMEKRFGCPSELCWWKHKLPVEPPMPDRSKCRDHTKCCPQSSRMQVWHGAKDPTPEKFTFMKPLRSQEPRRVVAPAIRKLITYTLFSFQILLFQAQGEMCSYIYIKNCLKTTV